MSEQQENLFSEDVLEELSVLQPNPDFVIPDWVSECSYTLVNNVEAFQSLLQDLSNSTLYAFDIETSGLNFFTDEVVGMSFSCSEKSGYYLPLKHKTGINMEESCVDSLRPYLEDPNKTVLMYNKKFDKGFMLEKYGMNIVGGFDVMALTYVDDPTRMSSALKEMGRQYFGIETIEIDQLFKAQKKGRKKVQINFAYADPEHAVVYASQDTDLTLRLYNLISEKLQRQAREKEHLAKLPAIVKLEDRVADVVQKMERRGVLVDSKRVDYLYDRLLVRSTELDSELSKDLGAVDVNSTKQLREALFGPKPNGLGLKPTKTTKTGEASTDEMSLQWLLSSTKDKKAVRVLKNLIEYRGVTKALSTYVKNIKEECDGENSILYFAFRSMKTDTGRFSAGAGGGHYCGVNIQSFPKNADAKVVMAKKIIDGDKSNLPCLRRDNTTDADLFVSLEKVKEFDSSITYERPVVEYYGDSYCLLKDCSACESKCGIQYDLIDLTELDPNTINYRGVIRARPGYKIGAFDYSNEELRIVANLSGDPLWVNAFLTGRDLHWEMAKTIFKLPDDAKMSDHKSLRKIAKTINFAILYGASAKKIAAQAEISEKEAEEILNQYRSSVPLVMAWIENQHRIVEQLGGITTHFGRFRPIKEIYADNMKEKSKAYRLAQNSPIQGACADIMKLMMVRLDREIQKRGYQDDIHILLTVHDELVLELREDKLPELVQFITETLTMGPDYLQKNLPDWKVPIEVGGDIGDSWGISLEWDKYQEVWNSVKFPHEKTHEEPVVEEPVYASFLDEPEREEPVENTPFDFDEVEPAEVSLPSGVQYPRLTTARLNHVLEDSILCDLDELNLQNGDDFRLEILVHTLTDPQARGDKRVYFKYTDEGVAYILETEFYVRNEGTVKLAVNKANISV